MREETIIVQTQSGYFFSVKVEDERRVQRQPKGHLDKVTVSAQLGGNESSYEKALERLAWSSIKIMATVKKRLEEAKKHG